MSSSPLDFYQIRPYLLLAFVLFVIIGIYTHRDALFRLQDEITQQIFSEDTNLEEDNEDEW